MEPKKLLKMLEMQNIMNQKVNPQWEAQDWSWETAIIVESSELLEHFGWKWWKNQNPDVEQAKMELVDIWHFGLSQLLVRFLEGGTHEQFAELLCENFEWVTHDNKKTFVSNVNELLRDLLEDGGFNIEVFSEIAFKLGLSFDELYTTYIGKNVLNKFRQDNGYKDGSYIKIWNGEEDNVHLVRIMKDLDMNDIYIENTLYEKLVSEYAILTAETMTKES